MATAPVETSNATVQAQVFWMRYRKEIVALLALALVALIVFGAYRMYRDRQESAAATMFARATTGGDYEQIIDRYGDTAAASGAYLLLAEEQRKARQYPQANATLQNFIERFPRHELTSTARMAMAANLEAMGKQEEAVRMYQQLAVTNSGSFNAPFALLAQAQILKASNRDDDARRVLETLMSQYQGNYATLEAMRLLRTLKPPAAAQPAATASSPPAPSPARPSLAPSPR